MAESLIDMITPDEVKGKEKKIKASQPKGKYPTKTTLNLMQRKNKGQSASNAVIYALLAILLLAALAIYGIYMPLQKYDAKKLTLQNEEDQLQTITFSLIDYNEVEDKYLKYSSGYLSEEETAIIDRQEVIDLVEEVIMPCGKVLSMQVKDSALKVVVEVDSYDSLSEAIIKLYDYDIVKGVSVDYANDSEESTQASLNVTLADNYAKVIEARKAEKAGEES